MAQKAKLSSVNLSNVKRDYAWYAVVTLFNYEQAYINNVKQAVSGTALKKLIKEYYVPIKYIKETIKKEDGTTKEKIRKQKGCYSNYVFIKCVMTSQIWNLLRTTTGVAVILTTSGFPTEISEEEIKKIRFDQRSEGFSPSEIQEMIDENNRNYVMKVNLDGVDLDESKFNTDFTS